MNSKKIALYGTILIVVVGIITITNMLANKQPSAKTLMFFPGFTAETATAMQITDATGKVRLEKIAGVWSVVQNASGQSAVPVSPLGTQNNAGSASLAKYAVESFASYPADSALIATALEKIKEMKKDQLISSNAAKQEVFEVDTSKGILLEVWNNKGVSLGSVRIGKSGVDYSSNFVRPTSSNNVYSVGGSPRWAFFTDIKRWRDKVVLSFNKSDITRVTLQKKGNIVIEISKSADTTKVWEVAGSSKSVNKAKISEITTLTETISHFMCADIETDTTLTDSVMGFVTPELIVTTDLKNNDRHSLIVGAKKNSPDNLFWVKISSKPYVYLVSDMDIQKLDKNEESLSEVAIIDATEKKSSKESKK